MTVTDAAYARCRTYVAELEQAIKWLADAANVSLDMSAPTPSLDVGDSYIIVQEADLRSAAIVLNIQAGKRDV